MDMRSLTKNRKLLFSAIGSLLIGAIAVVLLMMPGPDQSAEYIRDGDALYVNTAKDVKYLGSESCRDCHLELYEAFMKTTTARSMSRMDTSNIIEEFPQKEPVYDPQLDFYYEMVRRGDKFYQREYRLDNHGEVIHERMMEAQYIIGSGKNLRMYFYDENGMLYELPLTWYVHKNRWDMSPGYREFRNLRFSRFAGSKCLACHNAHMDASPVARERFLKPYPLGIGCEACHGPGELHVRQELGESVDLPSDDAKTIVNPVDLSPQRQIDVCQQCHLQGKAWALRGDAQWFDFRPGMLLQDLWSVYTYRTIHKEEFKVADSAFRFSLSRCYKESHGVTTCTTCHDSHGMFHGSAVEFNRQNCQKCHPPESLSGPGSTYAHKETDDCVSCHMKQTGTENTLHGVVNTDHWIRVDAKETHIDWTSNRTPNELQPIQSLMPILDSPDSAALTRRGIAFLDYYSNYDHRDAYLDSALHYLQAGRATNPADPRGFLALGETLNELKRYHEAKDFLANALELHEEFPEACFELGEVHRNTGNLDSAIYFYRQAIRYLPGEPAYRERLGIALASSGETGDAITVLQEALKIDRQNPETFSYLGNLYALVLHDPARALPYLRERVVLDPDAKSGYLNLANAYALVGNHDKAVDAYIREIYYRPNSAPAFFNLGKTYSLMGETEMARRAFERASAIDSSLVEATRE
jgi:tetratricopeptide (TPR) repeat protein